MVVGDGWCSHTLDANGVGGFKGYRLCRRPQSVGWVGTVSHVRGSISLLQPAMSSEEDGSRCVCSISGSSSSSSGNSSGSSSSMYEQILVCFMHDCLYARKYLQYVLQQFSVLMTRQSCLQVIPVCNSSAWYVFSADVPGSVCVCMNPALPQYLVRSSIRGYPGCKC